MHLRIVYTVGKSYNYFYQTMIPVHLTTTTGPGYCWLIEAGCMMTLGHSDPLRVDTSWQQQTRTLGHASVLLHLQRTLTSWLFCWTAHFFCHPLEFICRKLYRTRQCLIYIDSNTWVKTDYFSIDWIMDWLDISVSKLSLFVNILLLCKDCQNSCSWTAFYCKRSIGKNWWWGSGSTNSWTCFVKKRILIRNRVSSVFSILVMYSVYYYKILWIY